MVLEIKSRKGITYFQSDYDYSWWRRAKWDKPDHFIGDDDNLPTEIDGRHKIRVKEIKSVKGTIYFQTQFNDSWWIAGKNHKPNRFVGKAHNLPKEIQKQLDFSH